MTNHPLTLFIIFLRFGPNRAQAATWMAGHKQWIRDGIAKGTFLVAGSLDNAQGGAIVAAGQNAEFIQAVIASDPFVVHGVVVAEVQAVAPSLMADGLASLLQRSTVGENSQ